MRISDWSSDVCSSDLAGDVVDQGEIAVPAGGVIADKAGDPVAGSLGGSGHPAGLRPPCPGVNSLDICRPVSRCRSVGAGPSVPVSRCRSVGAGQSLPGRPAGLPTMLRNRSEEHTSELQSLMRISYAVFCLKK